MKKIAADVALLLPEKINKICIDINRKKDAKAYSDLSRKNNHPHITLAMGVIDEKDIPAASSKLKAIANKFSKLSLVITKIASQITPEKKKHFYFFVKPTGEVVKLHSEIMKKISPYFSYKSSLSMFYRDSDEVLKEVSRYWVDNYARNHKNPSDYHPHISLKAVKADYDEKFPIRFTASKIALCQLGNYCTCRTILASANLH